MLILLIEELRSGFGGARDDLEMRVADKELRLRKCSAAPRFVDFRKVPRCRRSAAGACLYMVNDGRRSSNWRPVILAKVAAMRRRAMPVGRLRWNLEDMSSVDAYEKAYLRARPLQYTILRECRRNATTTKVSHTVVSQVVQSGLCVKRSRKDAGRYRQTTTTTKR